MFNQKKRGKGIPADVFPRAAQSIYLKSRKWPASRGLATHGLKLQTRSIDN